MAQRTSQKLKRKTGDKDQPSFDEVRFDALSNLITQTNKQIDKIDKESKEENNPQKYENTIKAFERISEDNPILRLEQLQHLLNAAADPREGDDPLNRLNERLQVSYALVEKQNQEQLRTDLTEVYKTFTSTNAVRLRRPVGRLLKGSAFVTSLGVGAVLYYKLANASLVSWPELQRFLTLNSMSITMNVTLLTFEVLKDVPGILSGGDSLAKIKREVLTALTKAGVQTINVLVTGMIMGSTGFWGGIVLTAVFNVTTQAMGQFVVQMITFKTAEELEEAAAEAVYQQELDFNRLKKHFERHGRASLGDIPTISLSYQERVQEYLRGRITVANVVNVFVCGCSLIYSSTYGEKTVYNWVDANVLKAWVFPWGLNKMMQHVIKPLWLKIIWSRLKIDESIPLYSNLKKKLERKLGKKIQTEIWLGALLENIVVAAGTAGLSYSGISTENIKNVISKGSENLPFLWDVFAGVLKNKPEASLPEAINEAATIASLSILKDGETLYNNNKEGVYTVSGKQAVPVGGGNIVELSGLQLSTDYYISRNGTFARPLYVDQSTYQAYGVVSDDAIANAIKTGISRETVDVALGKLTQFANDIKRFEANNAKEVRQRISEISKHNMDLVAIKQDLQNKLDSKFLFDHLRRIDYLKGRQTEIINANSAGNLKEWTKEWIVSNVDGPMQRNQARIDAIKQRNETEVLSSLQRDKLNLKNEILAVSKKLEDYYQAKRSSSANVQISDITTIALTPSADYENITNTLPTTDIDTDVVANTFTQSQNHWSQSYQSELRQEQIQRMNEFQASTANLNIQAQAFKDTNLLNELTRLVSLFSQGGIIADSDLGSMNDILNLHQQTLEKGAKLLENIIPEEAVKTCLLSSGSFAHRPSKDGGYEVYNTFSGEVVPNTCLTSPLVTYSYTGLKGVISFLASEIVRIGSGFTVSAWIPGLSSTLAPTARAAVGILWAAYEASSVVISNECSTGEVKSSTLCRFNDLMKAIICSSGSKLLGCEDNPPSLLDVRQMALLVAADPNLKDKWNQAQDALVSLEKVGSQIINGTDEEATGLLDGLYLRIKTVGDAGWESTKLLYEILGDVDNPLTTTLLFGSEGISTVRDKFVKLKLEKELGSAGDLIPLFSEWFGAATLRLGGNFSSTLSSITGSAQTLYNLICFTQLFGDCTVYRDVISGLGAQRECKEFTKDLLADSKLAKSLGFGLGSTVSKYTIMAPIDAVWNEYKQRNNTANTGELLRNFILHDRLDNDDILLGVEVTNLNGMRIKLEQDSNTPIVAYNGTLFIVKSDVL